MSPSSPERIPSPKLPEDFERAGADFDDARWATKEKALNELEKKLANANK